MVACTFLFCTRVLIIAVGMLFLFLAWTNGLGVLAMFISVS